MALVDNILAYWKLDEASGNALDATGNAKTLTNVNTVGYAAGLSNNCADFGTANTNKVLSRTGLIGADGVYSISMFVKLRTEIGAGTVVFSTIATQSASMSLAYEYNAGTRRLRLQRQRNSTSAHTVYKTITLGTSNWYHLTGTYDGAQLVLYVNAVAEAPVAASGNGVGNWTPGGGFNSVGADIDANSGAVGLYASAYIDEVGLWQRALTSTEVTQLYAEGASTPYPFPLITDSAISTIAPTQANATANVFYDGGATITERGFCWNTSAMPTTANSKVVVSGTIGVYNGTLTGLTPNTLYFARAYFVNANGTTYGAQQSFTTLSAQYDLIKPLGVSDGQTFLGQITVTGTVGTITVKLGTTGTSTVIAAGAGVSSFSGTYSGLSGLIITRSADFNGTVDDVYYVPLPLSSIVDWSKDVVSLVSPIPSEVFFKRVEDDVFNTFRFYRYLELLFKDLDGYVTVSVRQEREDNTTTNTREFVVGNPGSGTVSPFQKKRISFLCKNQAIIIGLSNDNLNETFSIAKYLLIGDKKAQRMSSPSKIVSM